jgi:peptidoglycan glycosyltransferase
MNRTPTIGGSLLRVSLALAVAYGALAAGMGYWQVVEAQRLSSDPRNPLVLSAERAAPRGQILDANGEVLARNVGRGSNQRREYPYPVAAPAVGYKSAIFGTAGIERAYDGQLTGLLSVGPADELLRKFRSTPYDPADLVLSLDIRLQERAAELLGDRRGAVVAIEPATGRILALVSSPTYNPNRLADPARARDYMERLRAGAAEESPLLNRATQGLYVPGSVFKIVTAIAGLGSGAITPETTFEEQPAEYRTGFLVQGFRVHDFPRDFQKDHPLDFLEATEVSSNIWYAHAGLATGASAMVSWSERLGFGDTLPFELGTSPSQVTGGGGALAGFRDEVELANAAYGQAEVLVTPLQMALVAATIANGGQLMKPKLVDELHSSGGVTRLAPEAWRQVLPAADARIIRDAMVQAVEGRYGRFFAGGAKVTGVPTAGKSGTAELGDGSDPHSWFIGFAPADEPQIAVAVIVEHGGAGAQRAVPLGGELMSYYLKLAR